MAIITSTAIQDAVRTWLTTELTALTDVIFAEQAAPRPAVPFATVKLGAPIKLGYDDAGALTDPGAPAYASRAMRGDRRLPVSVQIFGAGAMDYARAASNALSKETIRDDLRSTGIAPVDNGTITDLTELLETDFEDRAGLEVVFVFADEYTDTVPLVEHVTATGTYTPGSKTDTIQADKT
jgi:hypothetical protein